MSNHENYNIYVAPAGNDCNDGSLSSPLATMNMAKQKANLIKEKINGDVVVNFLDGEYFVESHILFTPQDSGVGEHKIIYQAYEDAKPIFTSGRKITDWKNANDPQKAGLMVADATGIENTRQFYIDKKAAKRTIKMLDGENIERAGQKRVVKIARGEFTAYEGYQASGEYTKMLGWRNQKNIEFTYDISWVHRIIPVEAIEANKDGVFIHMQEKPFTICQMGELTNINTPTAVENAYELLENCGEWYFDTTEQKIYYLPFPDQNMNEVEAVIPHSEQFIKMLGDMDNKVRNITFRGLSFEYSSWIYPSKFGWPEQQANFALNPDDFYNAHATSVKPSASILLEHTDGIEIQKCEFSLLGGGVINLEDGVQNTQITECSMHDITGGGIIIGGVQLKDAHPFTEGTIEKHVHDERLVVKNNVVKNCWLNKIGTDFKGAIGIVIGYAEGNLISHNVISEVAYTGISLGWGWGYWDRGGRPEDAPTYPIIAMDDPTTTKGNILEHNRIYNVMVKMHDGGGIYTLSDMQDTIINGNCIHDIAGWPGGVYLDQGSGGMTVYDNQTWNTQMSHQLNFREDTYGHRFSPPIIKQNHWDISPMTLKNATIAGLELSSEWLMPKHIESVFSNGILVYGDIVTLIGAFGCQMGEIRLNGESGAFAIEDSNILSWKEKEIIFKIPKGAASGNVSVKCADGTLLTSVQKIMVGVFDKVLFHEDFKDYEKNGYTQLPKAANVIDTQENNNVLQLCYTEEGVQRLSKRGDWANNAITFELKFDSKPTGFDGVYIAPYIEHKNALPVYYAELLPACEKSIHMEQLIDDVLRGTGTANYNFEPQQWYHVKMAVIDKNVYLKVWQKNEAEPLEWSAQGIYSFVTDGGFIIQYKASDKDQAVSICNLTVLEYKEIITK